ncbi:FAD/NAD(P)-binding protein [Brevibacterium daeguense]|uniref:FAD/NAD(P)-binding protein n=1 Tax=Brevibacterium daeguense TaxID=909936 RepID=A0ABP8EKR4_9MICO|nr:FAD/NAD(P)-binding protein [Brevibacterium daeguense]
MTGDRLRIAIIGVGPRGLSVFERLTALAPRVESHLEIHLIDPHPPGAGQVWRTDQHPELLMNTTLGEQTVFPDASCGVDFADTGPDMAEWYRTRGGTAKPDSTFASRALYGRYLCWAHDHIRAHAAANVTTVHHPASATAIVEPTGIDSRDQAQLVRLSDGTTVEAEAVVLSVGHIPAQLTDERAAWARFAADSHLTYLPPGLPAEAQVERLPAGEPVIFRGFGLNFFDLQTLLTTGRGGRFEETADGLAYHPSGHEPILAPSSRRGVPYRTKPITPEHPLTDHRLRYFTPENVERLAGDDEPLHFNDQLWPLILADVRHGWYAALALSEREAFAADPGRLKEALVEGVDRHLSRRAAAETRETDHRPGRLTRESPAWSAIEADVVADSSRRLDLRRFLRPLEGLEFAQRRGGAGSLAAWMLDFLRADLAASRLGPERSPEKSLFAVLWSARAYLKELVAAGRIAEASLVTEIRGWFEDFVAGICDGPPPQRYAELIALTEAGLVDFVGPEVRITTSRAGEPAAFIADSPAVPQPVRAPALVDAASPANQVRYAADELISGMLERGQLAVAAHIGPDGIEQPLSGIVVEGPAHRTVDARGHAHPRRHCLSIQLSAVQLGLAIAANPGKRAQSLIDAHRIAESILGLAPEGERGSLDTRGAGERGPLDIRGAGESADGRGAGRLSTARS